MGGSSSYANGNATGSNWAGSNAWKPAAGARNWGYNYNAPQRRQPPAPPQQYFNPREKIEDKYTGNAINEWQSGGSPYQQALSGYANKNLNSQEQPMANPYQQGNSPFSQPNPHLDQMFNNASRSVSDQFNNNVVPGINATFGEGGRTGGGLHSQAISDATGKYGDSLGGLAANIYGSAYENAQDRTMTSQTQMGNWEQQGRDRDLQRNSWASNLLSTLEGHKTQDEQNVLGAARLPQQRLQDFANIIYGFPAIDASSTSTGSGSGGGGKSFNLK